MLFMPRHVEKQLSKDSEHTRCKERKCNRTLGLAKKDTLYWLKSQVWVKMNCTCALCGFRQAKASYTFTYFIVHCMYEVSLF